MKHGLGWIDPLQFGLLIQVGCPVDQVKGSKEQREGYSGNPVNLAHTVKGLLGLWGLGFWLFLGLIWGRRGAFGDRSQSRVPSRIGGEGCSRGRWVSCSVVLLEERLLLLLLLFVVIKEKIGAKTRKKKKEKNLNSLDGRLILKATYIFQTITTHKKTIMSVITEFLFGSVSLKITGECRVVLLTAAYRQVEQKAQDEH